MSPSETKRQVEAERQKARLNILKLINKEAEGGSTYKGHEIKRLSEAYAAVTTSAEVAQELADLEAEIDNL